MAIRTVIAAAETDRRASDARRTALQAPIAAPRHSVLYTRVGEENTTAYVD